MCSSVFLDVKQVHQFTSKATRGDKCLDKLGVTGDNLSHECQMRYMTFSILCNVWLFGCLVVWLFCRCLPSRHFAHWLLHVARWRDFSDFRCFRGIQSDLIFLQLKCKRFKSLFSFVSAKQGDIFLGNIVYD